MAITFVALNANGLQAGSAGTTTLTAPTGATTLDLDILWMVNKLSTTIPTGPAGYTLLGQQAVGTGTNAVDNGPILISAWYQVLTAAAASQSITLTGGSVFLAGRSAWRKATTDPPWSPKVTFASDVTSDVTFSAVHSANIGMKSGDHLYEVAAVTAASTTGSRACTIPGITATATAVESSNQSATGNHLSEWTQRYAATAGTQTGAATTTTTPSVATTGGAMHVLVTAAATPRYRSMKRWR